MTSYVTSCSQMTVHRMLVTSLKCRKAWICSLQHVKILAVQKAQKPAPGAPTITVGGQTFAVAHRFTPTLASLCQGR